MKRRNPYQVKAMTRKAGPHKRQTGRPRVRRVLDLLKAYDQGKL